MPRTRRGKGIASHGAIQGVISAGRGCGAVAGEGEAETRVSIGALGMMGIEQPLHFGVGLGCALGVDVGVRSGVHATAFHAATAC